jgi:hypothetical protein
LREYPNPGPYTTHYDMVLTLTQSSNSVTGTIKTTVTQIDDNHLPGWGPPDQNIIGRVDKGSITGTVTGSTLTIDTSGVSFTLQINGNTMKGSGTYIGGVGETEHYDINLKRGGGIGLGGLSIPDSPLVTASIAIGIAVTTIGIGISMIPPPPMPVSAQGETVPGGPSKDFLYLGGVGLTTPALTDPTGKPYPPKQYQSSQGPRCPIHGDIPCQAKFIFQNQNELGSWFCAKCLNEHPEGGGYPWGVNRI